MYGSLGGNSVALSPATQSPANPPTEEMRAEYELIERIDTKTAWELFIQKHKTGYFVELARERLKKLQIPPTIPNTTPDPSSRAEAPSAGQGSAQVAALPKPEHSQDTDAFKERTAARETANEPTSRGDHFSVAHDLQNELKRLGCDPGATDGVWGSKSQSALQQFAKLTGLGGPLNEPTFAALEAVTAKKERVCPLVCDNNEVEKDGNCLPRAPGTKNLDATRKIRAVEPRDREKHQRAEKSTSRSAGTGGERSCGGYGFWSAGQTCRTSSGRTCTIIGIANGKTVKTCQ